MKHKQKHILALMMAGALLSLTALPAAGRAKLNRRLAVRGDDAPAPLAAHSFGRLLVELEANIKWEAVKETWGKAREAWLKKSQAAESLQDVAKLLLELESYVKEAAVKPKWKTRRESWSAECKDATNEREVGGLLIEWESNLTSGFLEKDWQTRRKGWISEIRAAQAG